MHLKFLIFSIFLATSEGTKRDAIEGGRKPSLPPALRRHYFAARQQFQQQRDPQANAEAAYGGGGPTSPASNEYGRQPPAPDPYADQQQQPSEQSTNFQQSTSSSYQPNIQQIQPSSFQPQQQATASPAFIPAVSPSYQQQSTNYQDSAVGGYQQQQASQLSGYQQLPAAPAQQSYVEKPAPLAADYQQQTPAPTTENNYEHSHKLKFEQLLRRYKRELHWEQAKRRCRRETITAKSFLHQGNALIQHFHDVDIQNSPNGTFAQTNSTITSTSRAHGRRTQQHQQRVSPLDSLIGPEYSTGNNGNRQPLPSRGRNQNQQRERGQRGRPGQIPFPPGLEQTNEFAYVQQLRIPATGKGGRPLQRPISPFPGQQQQQQFGQGGPAGPPFTGGTGPGTGTPPTGVGILIGPAKNSRLPTLISTGHGRGGHVSTSSSKNLPYVNEAHRYYYPPRMPLPLPTCFHNPTGYPCCNPTLNDLMVETYTELESKPKFHTCNINAIAQHLQMRAEDKFNTSFETVAAFDDFAQKIHFAGDLVCKVELGGKYMLAYATVRDVDRVLPPAEKEDNGVANGESGALPGPSPVGPYQPGSGQQSANQGRRKRSNEHVFGPQLPLPMNDLSRRYSIWI